MVWRQKLVVQMELIILVHVQMRFYENLFVLHRGETFCIWPWSGERLLVLGQLELNANHKIITLTQAILNILQIIQATVCLTLGDNLLSKSPGKSWLVGNSPSDGWIHSLQTFLHGPETMLYWSYSKSPQHTTIWNLSDWNNYKERSFVMMK